MTKPTNQTKQMRDVQDKLIKKAGKLLSTRREILFAYAHGSFLEGTFFRDLDIALFIMPEKLPRQSYIYEMEVEGYLERRLGLDFPVDIRLLNNASIPFQYGVLFGCLLLDRDPDFRVGFFSWVVSRYLDIEPVLRHHTKEAFFHETQS